MPTFSAVAYPVTTQSSYTQTISRWEDLPEYYKQYDSSHMEAQKTLGDVNNDYQWWNYLGMNESMFVVDSQVTYPLNNPRNVPTTRTYTHWGMSYQSPTPGSHSNMWGHSNYELAFSIVGWQDLPEYIVPKGVECIALHASDHYYYEYNGDTQNFAVTLEKPDGTTAQKVIRRPDYANYWTEYTTGASTDKWFTSLSSSDVRGNMKARLKTSAPVGPSMGGGGWTFIDKLSFVLYFQTDWFYGIVGTEKGFQKKMNGIDLSTVAGANGMSREA